MQHLQWFPGHMTKTKRMIEQRIKLVDVVIELTDARLPLSSRNPLLDSLVGHKPRIVILNKEDLADPQQTALWMKYFDAQDNCQKSANVNAYWEPNTLRCLDRRTGRAINP